MVTKVANLLIVNIKITEMKKHFISKYIIGCFLLLGFTLGLASCNDDANDWGTDSSKNQMFTPVTFETSRISATAVDLSFSSVPNAKSYVVEYSKDSLQFTTIVGAVEFLADELIVDSTSSSKRFLAPLTKLDAATRYSARIKATSVNGLPDSKWGNVTFKTPSEQIISRYSYGETTLRLEWEAGLEVTHIILTTNGVETKTDLSPANIAEGTISFDNLSDNTPYTVDIYNGLTKRGSASFTTMQKVSGEGARHYMKGGEDLQAYLDGLTEAKVVLVIPAGVEYNVNNTLTIPAHMTSVTFWGLAGGAQSKMIIKEIKLDNSVTDFNIWIHNLEVSGTDASADYILNEKPTGKRTIGEFRIDNCNINTVRGVFRMGGTLRVNTLTLENNLISNIGSYGVVSLDVATVSVGTLNLVNSTIYNITNTNVMSFKGVTSMLNIDRCTFYNTQGKDKYIANFDNKAANIPATFSIKNCLFAASDGSITVRATNPKIESQFVFGSYKTNDYNVVSNYPLSGVEDYTKSSVDLFEDAANGKFKIVDTTIGGEAQPGDPRWW